MPGSQLSWLDIARIGLVQTALGAIVVLATSTMNRVMVVELALPAMVPGALVTIHYALQMLRPRWGYGSDVSRRRTPWIIGGMALLALGGTGASIAIALMEQNLTAGITLAILAFVLVGVGVGATGTSLLALLASRVGTERRAPAATIVWLMMIAGFVVTTIVSGSYLDPYSPLRLVTVTAAVSIIAFMVATLAIWGIEARTSDRTNEDVQKSKPDFTQAFFQVWSEPAARKFTIFIFVSMLAYSMQDLILEPFAGLVFGMTPGQSTKLSGLQNSGVFAGMLMVAVAAHPKFGFGSLRAWVMGGCLGSAIALLCIVAAGTTGPATLLKAAVFALGVANGAYASAAIGSMMGLAASGQHAREGTRMGIWGAAQAVAFGIGGFAGTAAVDIARMFMQPLNAYSCVFLFEAVLFVLSAALSNRVLTPQAETARDKHLANHNGLSTSAARTG